MPQIVILDGFLENPGDLSWAGLEALGALTVYDRTAPGDVAARIGGADCVYTNKTPVTAADMDACPNLRFISVLATGYNIVDVVAARARGITVCNVPEYGTTAVAQFTFALLLEVCHNAGHHAARVRDGEWQRRGDFSFWDYPLIELADKTLGIVGFGRIGQTVGKIAKAFGMKVLAHDKTETLEGSAIAQYLPLRELLAQSDVVSLHCPLFPDTHGIINNTTIAQMKDSAILLNTSRGPLVIEEDVAAALDSGKLHFYAADVASAEPPPPSNPLLSAKNCILTPHIAWAPREARARLMDVSVENLRRFLADDPIYVVNLCKGTVDDEGPWRPIFQEKKRDIGVPRSYPCS